MIKKILSSTLVLFIAFCGTTMLSNNYSYATINAEEYYEEEPEQNNPYEIQHSEDYDYRLTNEFGYVIVKYTGHDSNVTLPTNIDGNEISFINTDAFEGVTNLKKITFPKNVNLGSFVFYDDGFCTYQPSYQTTFISPALNLDIYCEGCTYTSVILSNPKNNKGDYKAHFSDVFSSNGFEYLIYQKDKAAIISYNGSETDVVVPDTIDNNQVIIISNKTFKSCTTLNSITFSQNANVVYYSLYDYYLSAVEEIDSSSTWEVKLYTKSKNILLKLSYTSNLKSKLLGIYDTETNSIIDYDLTFYDIVDINDTTPEAVKLGKDIGWTDYRIIYSEYDGKEKKIDYTRDFYNGSIKLIEGQDYSVSYKNNINAGNASKVFSGKGKYNGSIDYNFIINAADIKDCSISFETSHIYTGKEIKPKISIKFGNVLLKEGTDYTVSYSNNVNIGIAGVSIKGKGNFTNVWEGSFLINKKNSNTTTKKSINKATVSGLKNKYYTGKAITQTPTVKLGSKTLKKGTDYTVTFKNNKAVGKATVTIKGKGNYTGTVTKTFKIIPKKTTLKTAASPKKGQLKVTYTKQTNITGYQITYALDKNFTKSKASKSSAKLSKTISGLKSGKTYYVKVRTYKTVKGTKYYSDYSAVKKIKVK